MKNKNLSHSVVKISNSGTKNDPSLKKGGGTHGNTGSKPVRKEMSIYSLLVTLVMSLGETWPLTTILNF